jgi:hypothetical protein
MEWSSDGEKIRALVMERGLGCWLAFLRVLLIEELQPFVSRFSFLAKLTRTWSVLSSGLEGND